MDDEKRDPRVTAAELLATTLAGRGGTLLVNPSKVFRIAGLPLGDGNDLLFCRMLGLRDLALAYLVLKQRTARGRRTALQTLAGMAVVETALFALWPLPLRARLFLALTTAAAGVQAAVAATSPEDAPSGGTELLIAGYALALPSALELAPIVRNAEIVRFAAYAGGATLIGAGWLFRRNRLQAAVNLTAAAGGVVAWVFTRRRQAAARAAA